jgi:glycosyltransferase involved in cell wall biosynthesis
MKPFLSIVIPAYNEEKYLEDCLQSVFKQDIPVPFEVIVVDNASTDQTMAIAKKFDAKIVFESKKGLSYARQCGLDTAQGELLVYIDADTRLSKNWIKKIIHYFDTRPDVVGVSCNFYYFDGTLIEKLGFLIGQNLFLPFFVSFLRFINKPDVFFGQAMALRTEALRKSGGINRDFVFHGEDTSLANKLHTQGKVRFLFPLFVYCSARRYQREGLLKTLALYFTTYSLMQTGRYKRAKSFAKKHS